MSPRPDVSAERRARKRSDIIQAALACFGRKGYRNTTMDDIVAESGLSKGSLYWYFDGKDDLFVSAITSFFAGLGQEVLAGVEQHATASDKLRAIALELVQFWKRAEGLFNLVVEFLVQSSHREDASRLWAELLVQYRDVVADIIDEGVRNGEFKPVDSRQLVWAMMAAYDGLAVYITMIPDLDLDRVGQVFIETLLSGLAVDGQRSDQQGD